MESIDNLFNTGSSPLLEITGDFLTNKNLRVYAKRDDLLHPDISGNKWRKLKYNLLEARRTGYGKILTFGGAYSNHLAAVAAAGKEFGFSTMGIVRSEKCEPLNPTMCFVEACGMEVFYASRANFRQKNHNSIFQELNINPETYYILPEGGANGLAIQGCLEIVSEIKEQLGVLSDYIVVPCGTGATLAGIISGLEGKAAALGVSVLKGDFLKNDVAGFLENCEKPAFENWDILTDYHFGGYAKFTPELISFINNFKSKTGILLDPVYTGKLFYAVHDLAEREYFKPGSAIVLVHTGGLQGIAGFNERFGNLLEC